MSLIQQGLFRFGVFVLNADEMTLRLDDRLIPLSPKAFETLLMLIRHQGEVVAKEAMMSAVWPDTHVEESNLTQNIFVLRRKLGLTPTGEEYIQTIPKRGYRISVPVERVTVGSDAPQLNPVGAVNSSRVAGKSATSRVRKFSLAIVLLLAATALAGVLWRSASATPSVGNYIELSHDGGDKRGRNRGLGGPDATIATDGSRIYFTRGSSQTLTIMQISATGGETAPVVVPFGFPQLLDYSAARSELLVGSFEDPATPAPLWAVPVPAGVPHRLGSLVAADAAWSPDGREIAFVRGTELYTAKDDGTEVKKLASLAGIGWRPRWSPDGSLLRLTVADAKTAGQSIWEVSSDGKNLRPLFQRWSVPPGECCGSWTPDGKQFIFQATREGKTEVWSLPSPGVWGWLSRSARNPIQLTGGQMNSLTPASSPDGRKLYVMGQHLRGELAKYDPIAGQFLPLFGGIPADFIDFSRDGSWITYVEYPHGTLWRSRIDGTDRLQLTFPPLDVAVPQWSPDSKRIVFQAIGAGRESKIYVVSAAGGTPEPVSSEGIEINPTWLDASNSLVFSDAPFFSNKPKLVAIHTLDLRTRQRGTVPGSEGLFSPVASPNGRYIAALPIDGQRIMLYDSHSKVWSELTKGWGFVKWSADNQYLYYRRYGGTPAILRIRLTDRKVEEVASLVGFRQGGHLAGLHFALAPDGYPVLLRDTGTQEIYSLDWVWR